MAQIVVIGGGIGGLPTAYELRHLLGKKHRVTLISDRAQFTFIPSLPWVGMDLIPLERVQVDLATALGRQGIEWIHDRVEAIDLEGQQLHLSDRAIAYDYLIVATGAELAVDAVSGLGPHGGYTQSVCNPQHALIARDAWKAFLKNPGPLVVGAVPGASCMGPAYEFALLADFILRKYGLRDRVPITFITPEPYAGHLGIGGMANSSEMVTALMKKREVTLMENTEITSIERDRVCLSNGESVPFAYSMLLPPFRGPRFVRSTPGLGDENGFIPVLPTGRHRDFPSVYAAGIAVAIAPPEVTPLPLGVPKTGQMTEAMGMAAAHNIALELGVMGGKPVKPTLEAICMADFGDTGLIFIADPVLPDRKTGKRRRAVVKQGRWVSWSKLAFETFFLAKMRWGMAVPWFERLGLRTLGLSLVEPLDPDEAIALEQGRSLAGVGGSKVET
jgi:sulfide:quinone oxidoreductase